MKDKINPQKFGPFVWIALFGIFLAVQSLFVSDPRETIDYSEFLRHVNSGNIAEVVIEGNTLRGKFKNLSDKNGVNTFVTYGVKEDLAKLLGARDIKFSHVKGAGELEKLIGWLLPIIVFVAIWMFILKRMGRTGMGGGFVSVGKNKAKIYMEKEIGVTFKDVAGVDEAKRELIEVVDFLKDAERYQRLGGRMPKGLLLVGPPGTGKTLIAKAVAGEASVPFFSISGSEFVEMFVGVGAARVRDLFAEARKRAPCIIFIDELDALGKARGQNPAMGGHDEKEQTLNQLLTELDGFDSKEGIILLGATNRPEILDPALLRAGRFDRQVLVDRPDKKGRIEILRVHIKPIKVAPDLVLENIAGLTTGFTGADLANLCNEAALVATRRDAQHVEEIDFNEAIERIIAGLEKRNRILNPFERGVTAYHELGHAIVASILDVADVVHKVSIIPRGVGALGYTMQRPLEDRFLMKKEELIGKLSVLLGGRAAELVKFDHLSTGASDDLIKATDIARSMATRYGMIENLGHVAYEREQNSFLGIEYGSRQSYSDETNHTIDVAVKKLIEDALKKSVLILEGNKEILEKSAKKLLEVETLETKDLDVLFKDLNRNV